MIKPTKEEKTMKNRSLLLFVIVPLILAGCGHTEPVPSGSIIDSSSEESSADSSSTESSSAESSSSSDEGFDPSQGDVIVEMSPMLKTTNTDKPYQISLKYKDEYFTESAKTYNKDLSMLSFGAAMVTGSSDKANAFFTETGFSNITLHDFDKEPTKDTMGYIMAHKTIDDAELVAVTFRGLDYGLEWTNNFLIGKTGNHEGFNLRAEEAYTALQTYVNTYAQNKTLKLWISGYSRGGAISNTLASIILKGDKVNVTQDNMFVYTYEAPTCVSEEDAIAYENVFNITNEADLIASIPPANYGLKRCGIDYQIYDANVSTLLREFDEEAVLPEFVAVTATDPLEKDTDLLNFVLTSVFNKEETSEDKTIYANTREEYVDNYQDGLSSCIGYIFALKPETRNQLLEKLKTDAMTIIGDQTGQELYNVIKPLLDKDNVVYDDAKLLADCALVIKAVGNLFIMVLFLYALNTDFASDLSRLISMHYTETVYVLLKNAHSKEASN